MKKIRKIMILTLSMMLTAGAVAPAGAQAATFSYKTHDVKIDKKVIKKRKPIATAWLKKSEEKSAQAIMNKVTEGKANAPIGKFDSAKLHKIQLALRLSYFRYAEKYSALPKDSNTLKLGILSGTVGQTTFPWKVDGQTSKKAVNYNKAFENFIIKNINDMGIPSEVKSKGMKHYVKHAEKHVKKMLKSKNYITNENIKAYRKKVGDSKFIKNIAKEMHYYLVYETEYASKTDLRIASLKNQYNMYFAR